MSHNKFAYEYSTTCARGYKEKPFFKICEKESCDESCDSGNYE